MTYKEFDEVIDYKYLKVTYIIFMAIQTIANGILSTFAIMQLMGHSDKCNQIIEICFRLLLSIMAFFVLIIGVYNRDFLQLSSSSLCIISNLVMIICIR